MKILFVIDSLGTGGAERSTADLWYYLMENKIPFKVIALRHRTEGIQSEVLARGIDATILSSENFVQNVRHIVSVIRGYRPTHVHSILFKSNLRTRMARLIGVPFRHIEALVNTTYSKERFNDKKVNVAGLHIYKWIDRLTGKNLVDHFIANTADIKQHYVNNLGISQNKISVIYRGRKPNPYLDDRMHYRRMLSKELGIPDDTFIFIVVGRQEFQKGQTYALAAFNNLVREYPEVRLLFVGRQGGGTEELESLRNQYGLDTKVFFLGHRNDVMQILAGSDALVFPSVYEGIGGAVIEALAAGLPIISSDLPGLREVISEENAMLVEPKSVHKLTLAMKKIIEDFELRVSMKVANQDLFNSRFQLENIHRSVMDVYERNIIQREAML